MLTIPRRTGESIAIGDDITITVIKIGGDKAWLQIGCPTETSVHRGELYDAIRAAQSSPSSDAGLSS